MIPEHQAVRLAHPGGGGYLDIVPDEGRLDAADPRIEAPARTIEYSISLSAMTQPDAIEVNGPM